MSPMPFVAASIPYAVPRSLVEPTWRTVRRWFLRFQSPSQRRQTAQPNRPRSAVRTRRNNAVTTQTITHSQKPARRQLSAKYRRGNAQAAALRDAAQKQNRHRHGSTGNVLGRQQLRRAQHQQRCRAKSPIPNDITAMRNRRKAGGNSFIPRKSDGGGSRVTSWSDRQQSRNATAASNRHRDPKHLAQRQSQKQQRRQRAVGIAPTVSMARGSRWRVPVPFSAARRPASPTATDCAALETASRGCARPKMCSQFVDSANSPIDSPVTKYPVTASGAPPRTVCERSAKQQAKQTTPSAMPSMMPRVAGPPPSS